MPGGREAYMPFVKDWPRRRSVISPSMIQTSSQTSWVSVPLGVVSAPART